MKKALITILVLTFPLLLIGGADTSNEQYEPVQRTEATRTAYIERFEGRDGQWIAAVNLIDWYEGEVAVEIFQQLEPDAGIMEPPDGYYIVNEHDHIEHFTLADDAVVIMQIYNRTGDILEADIVWNERISPARFAELLAADEEWLKDFPYHLVIEEGQIKRIIQQYIP